MVTVTRMSDRILVVDDEPNLVRVCQRFLEKSGFEVIATTDPSQALTILASQPLNLLLVDIRMPALDGFQLLRLARGHQPDIASVVMTGFGTVETAITALHQGADDLILKPFSGTELVKTVQRALKVSEQRREVGRIRALRPLFRIAETLFAERDYERLVELILETVTSLLDCNSSAIYRYQSGEDTLELIAQHGSDIGEIQIIEQDKFSDHFIEGSPIWISREGFGNTELRQLLERNQLNSLLCIPLMHTESNNVLFAVRKIGEPVFSAADLEMFVILARHAGLALENARLYAELHANVRELENTRKAMNQAERMATSGRLTASIAHEINNPLQALHNCLHLAGREELPDQVRNHYLEMAQIELERLMAIVQRMLEFYRPGLRDRKAEDVNKVVEKVVLLVETQLKKEGIKIKTDLSPDLPSAMIVGNQIQQVLLNLIVNSMEAMPDGGEVMIITRPLQKSDFASQKSMKGIEILVQDTGPGISEADRDWIFEPFMSTKEHGTGLGLSISYGIISAHGGSLALIEGDGRGACFRIELPEENENES
jgi:signal transduction histidine kinase/CheY-like chemotaxis protein